MTSIIIVNYNRIDLTLNCIKSLYQYSNEDDFEIILIDNNSKVGNVDVIKEEFPKINLIKNDVNIGFSSANNQGLEIAKGEYILFLNNDTLFIENTLDIVLKYYKSLKKPALIGCKLLNADGTHQDSIADFESISNMIGENFFLYPLFKKNKYINRFHYNYKQIEEPINVDIVKGAFIFGEKKYLLQLNGFDERFYFYSEENDLCKRFKNNFGDVIYFPNTKIIHLGGATTVDMPWFSIKNLSIGKIQLFQRNFGGINFFTIVAIHYLGIVIRIPIYFISGVVTFNSNLIKKAYNYFRLFFIYPKNRFK